MEARFRPTIFLLPLNPEQPPAADADEPAGEPSRLAWLTDRVTELEEALAARDDLIRLVAHELRNPLAPVFFQAHHLMAEVRRTAEPSGGTVASDWLVPRLELFLRGLDRLLDRLNRLMDVAALQSEDGIVLATAEVDLSMVASGVAASLASEAAAAGTRIDLSAPAPVTGQWDQVRLEQIIFNLLSNAIRYGAGSAIEIVVSEKSPEMAELVVRDQGPGIAEEMRPRLFQRMERTGTRPHRGGLGLGLWIVRRLCGAMGGAVAVESHPGAGAAFSVTLPRGMRDAGAAAGHSISADAIPSRVRSPHD